MSETTYAPGDVIAVVTRRGVAMVAADLAPQLLTRIWEQLNDGRGLAAVLEALTGAFGTSLAAIPAFAVALDEGEALRVAVRGALSIVVETPTGTETVSGVGVTTWSERIVGAVSRATLRADGAAETPPPALPIRDGVVRAAAVIIERSGAAAPLPVAPPAPPRPPLTPTAPSAPPEAPEPAAAPSVTQPAALIDSTAVLSMTSADTLLPQDSTLSSSPAIPAPPTEPADAAAPAEEPVGVTTGYDHLWGATVVRSVEEAAVRREDEDEDGDGAASSSVSEGDHDGATISVAEARALRAGAADAGLVDSGPPPLAPARAGAIGRIRLSNGQVVVLDRTVVIGRRPRSTRVLGTDLPHLIAVDSPQQDISRSHIEVRAEGDSILVTDLNTTNGSTLLRAGADPVRLHPGERTVVVIGDVIDLGDGISFAVEAES